MLAKIKEYYNEIALETANAVLWAEDVLSDKSGIEKKQAVIDAVVNSIDGLITLPACLEWADGPIIRAIVAPIVDKICGILNICTDGNFKDAKIDAEQLSKAVDMPLDIAVSAIESVPSGGDKPKQEVINERMRELVERYDTAAVPVSVNPTQAWEKSIRHVLASEGGYVNHPKDKGGATNRGITAATLAAAYAQGVVTHNNIQTLTKAEAMAIYKCNYWDCYGLSDFAWPGCLLIFDAAVNHGGGGMAKIAQRTCKALGIDLVVDGKWGPKTKQATREAAEFPGFVGAYFSIRSEYYDAIVAKDNDQKVFLAGWRNRLKALEAAAANKEA